MSLTACVCGVFKAGWVARDCVPTGMNQKGRKPKAAGRAERGCWRLAWGKQGDPVQRQVEGVVLAVNRRGGERGTENPHRCGR